MCQVYIATFREPANIVTRLNFQLLLFLTAIELLLFVMMVLI